MSARAPIGHYVLSGPAKIKINFYEVRDLPEEIPVFHNKREDVAQILIFSLGEMIWINQDRRNLVMEGGAS